jgi:hypothetical protein
VTVAGWDAPVTSNARQKERTNNSHGLTNILVGAHYVTKKLQKIGHVIQVMIQNSRAVCVGLLMEHTANP